LKISGVIGPGDYLGLEMFILADGREVVVEKYRLSEMTVGSCVLRDFVVGVMEEGGMLLGMGYLGLFDSWELDQSTQTLRTRN
jgi:predicted aspartyl protease